MRLFAHFDFLRGRFRLAMATGKVATDVTREVNHPEEGLNVSITPLTANSHNRAAATENVSSLARSLTESSTGCHALSGNLR